MKIVHLSDLHLGKRLNEFSIIEDQKYILSEIIKVIDNENADVVIIAGDIYDKSVPPVEAIKLFDSFLTSLAERSLPVLIISGNHDSAERIAFGSRLMEASNIYLSPAYNGVITPVIIEDEFGPVNFYMLPFIRPAQVHSFFENETIKSYTDAMDTAIKHMNIDTSQRNVLIAHQFVTGAETCDSEEISVGGVDNVAAWVFDDFDYVALGHIHKAQNIGSEKIAYSGTPLKYSFSECGHKKGVKIVEFFEKSGTETRAEYKTIPLVPLRDMREIKGSYNDLMLLENYKDTDTEDYIHITLTDEEDILNGFSRLQSVYKNLMKLDYDNKRTRHINIIDKASDEKKLSPLELFQQFYELQNNKQLDKEQEKFISELIENIWEGEE